MALRERLQGEPQRFLVQFCGAAAVLFLLRSWLWTVYLATIVPCVNMLLALGEGAVQYEVHDQALALVYAGFDLRFTIHDIIYQNLIVAISLFLATPGSWRWRRRWITIVVAVLWLTHLASLYAGGQTVIWDYVGGLGEPGRHQWAARVAASFPPASDWFYSRAFGLWHTWGRHTIVLLVWLLAAGDYLKLGQRDTRD